MSEIPPDPAILAEIEAAIAAGETNKAREAIAQGEMFFGRHLAFDDLKSRLESVAEQPKPEEALEEARARVHRADYPAALEILHSALALDPENAELLELRRQTEEAAQRHAVAVERNRAVAQAATMIQQAIESGDARTARHSLEETGIRFGRHPSLEALGEKLDDLEIHVVEQKISRQLADVRNLLSQREWRGAVAGAEQILKAAPEHPEAQQLLDQAKTASEEEIARQHQASSIDQIHRDVDRLIGAGELGRAGNALRDAIQRFGPNETFASLEQQISRAHSDAEGQQRVEWIQRRAKESAELVQVATHLSRKGDFETAAAKLRQAQELDPKNSEIEGLLQAAMSGSKRRNLAQKRKDDFQNLCRTIRQHLDTLDLDSAEALLHAARRDYGEEAALQPLQERLGQLRQVQGGRLRLKDLDRPVSRDELSRQQSLGSAYTWKQALFFPFRDSGPAAFGAGLMLLLVLEVLGGLFWPIKIVRWTAALVFAAFFFQIFRITLRGQNLWPVRSALTDPRRWGSDAAWIAGAFLLSSLPLLLFLASASYHGLLEGAFGWILFTLLLWLAFYGALFALGAVGGFGSSAFRQVPQHARTLLIGEPDSWLVVHLFFGICAMILLLRAAVLPLIPWLGMPAAVALEVYALLAGPHVLAMVMRRHGAQWARLYGVR